MKLVIVLALAFSCQSFAYEDFDVDWPPSNEKGIHVLAITIDGCETRFKIKDKDFYSATKNHQALKESVQIAIKRAHSGCKN